MDYSMLLDSTVELAYQLAMSGAETFRIEECVYRIMSAYGVSAEAFAIPNCLHISIETPDGVPMTRMRRIQNHGNDLDAVETFSNLSRRICIEKPDPETVIKWIDEAKAKKRTYSLPITVAGSALGAFGFAFLFGSTFTDALCAGFCGIILGIFILFMDYMKVNPFFKTICASFLLGFTACTMQQLTLAQNESTVIIAALMILVPGLLITNAMRDIIYGDINSGINRIVQVFLTAAAIALGVGAALSITSRIGNTHTTQISVSNHIIIELAATFIACFGFSIIFNIHGKGILLCALGGLLTWFVYRFSLFLVPNDILAYFLGGITSALYSELMARIRKFPAISYLVISIFPLIPGAGVYYTMTCVVQGNMNDFANQGINTIAIAGAIAVGILLVSSLARMLTLKLQKRNPN